VNKQFFRNGDYWVIRDVLGNEHARFETNTGVAPEGPIPPQDEKEGS